jgi:hypothetical protein
MMQAERELITHRIIAGCRQYKIDGNIIFIKQPDRYHRYIAEEVYHDNLYKAELDGSYTEQQLLDFLIDHNLWDENKQGELDDTLTRIEDLKLELFESAFKTGYRNKIRKTLSAIRKRQAILLNQRHEFDHISAAGVAAMAKARYLIVASLHKPNGNKLFDDDGLWLAPDFLIEQVAEYISNTKADERIIRELARTEPWRTMWISRKSEQSMFGIPAVDLTEEQRGLSIWSTVYDNIYEHPECPQEDVISDDDMLDGWMIAQRKKREAERGGSSADNFTTNEKIRNAEEIFIPAETLADARKVDSLNDAGAAILKRKRMNITRQKGIVSETDMPDSQLKIRSELTKMFRG